MAKQLNINMNFTADTSNVESNLNKLKASLNEISNKPFKMDNATKEIKDASNAAIQLKAHLINAFDIKTGNLNLSKFQASLSSSGQDIKKLSLSLLNAGSDGRKAFSQLQNSILNSNIQLRQSNGLLTQFGTTLKNTAKWQISSSMLHGLMGAIQSAKGYAEDLNKSLTNIRIVTQKSTDDMAKFAEQANKAAKSLNITTTAYTNASLIYYQQGLDDNEVKERTDVTMKMSNVTGESAEHVSSYMTAIWNNFDDGSRSLEHYSDVITALGAATASSSEEIAEGLEKFSAVADTVGLSYDYATTALATVTAQTRQSADVVGTAFKTLFARIQDLELGETLDDGTTLGTYSQALEKVGINIKDSNGQMKEMDEILNEMGSKWKTLDKDQQTALAQNVAGVRQYTQLVALMDNWDKFQVNLEVAQDSEGTLQEQADIYAESWEGAQKRVKASLEGLYNELIPTDSLIKGTNALADFLEGTTKIIDSIGGLKTILLAISTVVLKSMTPQISSTISSTITGVDTLNKGIRQTFQELKNQDGNKIKKALDFVPTAKNNITNYNKNELVNGMNKAVNETYEKYTRGEIKDKAFIQDIKFTKELNGQYEKLEQSGVKLTEQQQEILKIYSEQAKSASDVVAEKIKLLDKTKEERAELEKINEEYYKQHTATIVNRDKNGKVVNGSYRIETEGLEFKSGKRKGFNNTEERIAQTKDVLNKYITKGSQDDNKVQIKTEEGESGSQWVYLNAQEAELKKIIKKMQSNYNEYTQLIDKINRYKELKGNTKNEEINQETSQQLNELEQDIRKLSSNKNVVADFTNGFEVGLDGVADSARQLKGELEELEPVISQEKGTFEQNYQTTVKETDATENLTVAKANLKDAMGKMVQEFTTAGSATNNFANKITGVMNAASQAFMSFNMLNSSIESLATASGDTTTILSSLGSLLMALPMMINSISSALETLGVAEAGATMGISLVITGIITAISAWSGHVKGLIEDNKKAAEEATKTREEFESLFSSVDAGTESFEENAQEINKLTNEYNKLNKEGENTANTAEDIHQKFDAAAESGNELAKRYKELIEEEGEYKNLLETYVDDIENYSELLANTSGIDERTEAYNNLYETIKKAKNAELEQEYEKGIDEQQKRKTEFADKSTKISGAITSSATLKDFAYGEVNTNSGGLRFSDSSFSNTYLNTSRFVTNEKVIDLLKDMKWFYATDNGSIATFEFFYRDIPDVIKEGKQLLNAFDEEGKKSKGYQNLNKFITELSTESEDLVGTTKSNIRTKAAITANNIDYNNKSLSEILEEKNKQKENFAKNNKYEKGSIYYEEFSSALDSQISNYLTGSLKEAYDLIQGDEFLAELYNNMSEEEQAQFLQLSKEQLENISKSFFESGREKDIFGAKKAVTAQYEKNEFEKRLNNTYKSYEFTNEQKKDIEVYKKYLEKELNISSTSAEELAQKSELAKIGLEDLSKNLKQYVKNLDDSRKGTIEYAEALSQMQDTIGNIVGFDITQVLGVDNAEKFVKDKKIQKLLEKATEGSQDAANQISLEIAKKTAENATNLDDNIKDTVNSLGKNTFNYSMGQIVKKEKTYDNKINNKEIEDDVESIMDAFWQSYESKNYAQANTLRGILNSLGWFLSDDNESFYFIPPQTGETQDKESDKNKLKRTLALQKQQEKLDLYNIKESHRYDKINSQLEEMDRILKRLSKEKDNAFGVNRIKSLDKEIAAYKKQIKLLKQQQQQVKSAISSNKNQAETLASQLGIGLSYNSDGTVSTKSLTNIQKKKSSITQAKNVNSANLDNRTAEEVAITEYNLSSQEQSLSMLESIINYINQDISTLQDLPEQIEDAKQEIKNLRLEKIDVKYEIKLKINEHELNRLERALKKFNEESYTTAKQITLMSQKIGAYAKTGGNYISKIIDELMEAGMTKKEAESIVNGGVGSKEYDRLVKKYNPDKTIMDKIDEALSAAEAEMDAMKEQVEEMFDLVISNLDKFAENIEKYTSVLEHNISIVENIKSIMDLTGQTNNATGQLVRENLNRVSMLSKVDKILSDYNNYSVIQKETKEARSELIQATKLGEDSLIKNALENNIEELEKKAEESYVEIYNSWSDAISLAYDIFEEDLKNATKMADNIIAGLYSSLDLLSEAMSRMKTIRDDYVRNYDKDLNISKISRDISKSIKETDSITAKQRLIKLQSKLNDLQEKQVKLSQHDVENLQKQYDLTLSLINLQNAQENKNFLRMQRDANGNWNYVYTTNQEDIEEKKQAAEDNVKQILDANEARIDELTNEIVEEMKYARDLDINNYKDENGNIDMLAYNAALNESKNRVASLSSQLEGVFDSNKQTLEEWNKEAKKYGLQELDESDLTTSFNQTSLSKLIGFGTTDSLINNYTEGLDKLSSDITSSMQTLDQNVADINSQLEALEGIETNIENIASILINREEQARSGIEQETQSYYKISSDFYAQMLKFIQTWYGKNGYGNKYNDIGNALNRVERYYDSEAAGYWLGPVATYATGGYTGSWSGEDGKFAVLHQKELVLNEQETTDFLKMIEELRQMQLYSFLPKLNYNNVQTGNKNLNQNVTISAEFPNVTDRKEIEEAFNTMVNAAAQYSNRLE